MYLFGSFLVFISLFSVSLSLSLLFTFTDGSLLVQVKQIGIVLQSFYYNRGRGGYVQG